jgi:hypothetical protein
MRNATGGWVGAVEEQAWPGRVEGQPAKRWVGDFRPYDLRHTAASL